MTAPHIEQVNVLRRADEPAHFLWQGRLYAVRSVRAHWFEQRGHDGSPGPLGAIPVSATTLVAVGGDSPEQRPPLAPDDSDSTDADRELWRVEAAAGRSAVPGVFDLCLAWPGGEWTLSPVTEDAP